MNNVGALTSGNVVESIANHKKGILIVLTTDARKAKTIFNDSPHTNTVLLSPDRPAHERLASFTRAVAEGKPVVVVATYSSLHINGLTIPNHAVFVHAHAPSTALDNRYWKGIERQIEQGVPKPKRPSGKTSSDKGKRGERAAVKWLVDNYPDAVLPNAQRLLGAGRALDIGDLYAFPDVAVQVRAYQMSQLPLALRSAAADSAVQADRAGHPYGVGMVPIPNAPSKGVKWLAAGVEWPTAPRVLYEASSAAKVVDWLRDPNWLLPREFRVGRVTPAGNKPYLVGPMEAWMNNYIHALSQGV